MIEKFEKMITELYGKDYENAINYCIEDNLRRYGEEVTLDDLFITWGKMCEQAKEMK